MRMGVWMGVCGGPQWQLRTRQVHPLEGVRWQETGRWKPCGIGAGRLPGRLRVLETTMLGCTTPRDLGCCPRAVVAGLAPRGLPASAAPPALARLLFWGRLSPALKTSPARGAAPAHPEAPACGSARSPDHMEQTDGRWSRRVGRRWGVPCVPLAAGLFLRPVSSQEGPSGRPVGAIAPHPGLEGASLGHPPRGGSCDGSLGSSTRPAFPWALSPAAERRPRAEL